MTRTNISVRAHDHDHVDDHDHVER